MCPKPLFAGDRRLTLRTRWNRARARVLAFESDLANRHRDSLSAKEQERFPPRSRWLSYDDGYDYQRRIVRRSRNTLPRRTGGSSKADLMKG